MKNNTTSLLCALAGLSLHAPLAWPIEYIEPAGEIVAQSMPADAAEDQGGYNFYTRINVLTYGVIQDVKDSPVNPGNFLELPHYQAVLNPRADFYLEAGRWELALKPRAELAWERWDEGRRDGEDDTRSDLFINEGFVRFRPMDELLLSLGRENLQWGPSVIMSSSNPFNRDNGRNNPRIEVPGLDFVRAVWIPDPTWTLSAIVNTGAGRLDEADLPAVALPAAPDGAANLAQGDDFERSYALKLDYTGTDGYFSLIPSYRKNDQHRLGFFGGWNASEALLLYTEGSVGEEDERLFQLGAAYTLEAGPTINVEYLRNNEGCVDKPIAECFLRGEVGTRDVLFRRDYLMLQYTDTDLTEDLSVNLRLLSNLNDHSNRVIGIFEYEVGDHIQLYLIGNAFTGSTDTEFGSVLRYSVFLGAGYTF